MMERPFLVAFSLAQSRILSKREPAIHRYSAQGFTVLELIVIVAIIGILAIVTTLNLYDWKANVYLKTAAREVVSNFQFARVEAAKRNATVSVQLTEGGKGVGKCEVIISGQTIRKMTMPANVTLTPPTTPITTFQISNRGFPIGPGGTVFLTNGNRTYNVVLSPAGAISLNGPI